VVRAPAAEATHGALDAEGDVHRVVTREARARDVRHAGALAAWLASGARALAAPGPERELALPARAILGLR
jgi:IS5 family transposase